MHVAQIRHFDVANGPGIRASLFVSGCTHQCQGCFNLQYKDFSYGTQWSHAQEDEFVAHLRNPNIRGVTILGGEPLDQVQDNDLLHLLKRIKKDTGKNIWLYSGYTWEEILKDRKKLAVLSHVDVLVDGRFIEARKNLKLKFKGSDNQRTIDVKSSLKHLKPVLLPEYS
ncbi:MAG: anaerobic ribonucleoside-triphosphate reductase activating protein [Turicibacter sp.]|nr:anaerobic ribonucleoside-triphosphate reductase activating protein [Turicibacter sp.]